MRLRTGGGPSARPSSHRHMYINPVLRFMSLLIISAIVGVSCGQPKANDIEGSIVLHDARFAGRMDEPCHQLLPG